MTDPRPFHVLLEVDGLRFHSKLREIEAWLADWEVDAEIGSVLVITTTLRIRFADERAAYAFRRCYGGTLETLAEVSRAQAADKVDSDLYEQLARKYPD
ncbi:hypothetical protein QO058_30280 (plasmid) [Bosea vestrisii]|uniref:hypothetical protein n=1 Tax=Bosea vestrisii TaxID=151416 RepID=UPI0024E0219C|nr:hypothetical protein [Bosea vestrisii]WID99690.1 hypothetical protein QO058_30280 [Bosea vestrisii]